MAETVWDKEVRRLVDEQQRVMRQLGARIEALEKHHKTALSRLEVRAEELDMRRDDPVVLYANRHAGPSVRYHDDSHPCGLAKRIDYPVRVLLGDAVARGIERCKFCGPHAGPTAAAS